MTQRAQTMVEALEEISKEVFTDGKPTKAARTAIAALRSAPGGIEAREALELEDLADEIEQSDGIALMLTGGAKQIGIRRTTLIISTLRSLAALPQSQPVQPAGKEEERPPFCATADSVCHYPACSCARWDDDPRAPVRPDAPVGVRADLDELWLLVDEYRPSNHDWSFRKGVIKTVIDRLAALSSAPVWGDSSDARADGGAE